MALAAAAAAAAAAQGGPGARPRAPRPAAPSAPARAARPLGGPGPAAAAAPLGWPRSALASRVRCRAAAPDAPGGGGAAPPRDGAVRRQALAALLGVAAGCGGRRRCAQAAASAASAAPRGGSGRRVAVVTGASSGIGKAAVVALARSGVYGTVVLAGRDPKKHGRAMDDVRAAAGRDLRAELAYLPLDLASLASVRECAKAFEGLGLPLHALINNGGVMALPERVVTADGYEYQFQVDYLSHFLLTGLLLPHLERSGSLEDPARVISVSSSAHFVRSPLAFGDTSDLNSSGADEAHGYFPWTAYGQAKLAQVDFTYELARRLRARYGGRAPVVAHVLHPGVVRTDIDRYLPSGQKLPSLPFVKSADDGAKTLVYLATSSDASVVQESGQYWEDSRPALSLGRGANPAPWSAEMAVPGSSSYDAESWARLWTASEALIGDRVVV